MTLAASAAEDLRSRPRRREWRDVSHRFRRGPRRRARKPLLVLAIALATLLAFVLRAEPPRSHARVPVVAPAPAAAPALPLPAIEPAPAFQIQVGSFVEAGNAARMAEQLRAEGRAVETLTVEARRVRYRVLASIEDGADGAALLARLRELGLSPRIASGAVAVTGFLSTPEADDIAGRLEEEGIVVRVEEENRAVSYHVVRIGGYPTAEAAERGRAELAARGLEGFVVRVQQGGGSIDP